MKTACLISCLVAIVMLKSSNADIQSQDHLEFEALLNATQPGQENRTQASLGSTLLVLNTTGSIGFTVCLSPESGYTNVNFAIDTIQYSNDGASDVIAISFNGSSYASFTTYANANAEGTGWNVMKNSGRLGTLLSVPAGNYSVALSVQTDSSGVELDMIRIYTERHDSATKIFCGEQYVNN